MTPDRDPTIAAVAIVGMAGRFPGARDLTEYWRLLREGKNAITEVPRDRFDIDALYSAEPATPGHVITRFGGFLEEVDRFDPAFFGISPREAERLDPQQRLLLELGAEALQDAGQRPSALAHSRTGVFVGLWANEYESRLFRDPGAIDFYMTQGTGRYTASGRLSHVFDLNGPSFTVDAACSSSLVAVHLACQSLRNGDCDAALVGAANLILEPFITLAYSQSRMMAPDGRCKFGDAAANGYVRSDGAAALFLKPLARALADGDRVYATLLGSSITSDGASGGSFGRPAPHGQREMLRLAYEAAGVDPASVDYVEAHGTGTRAGDPVELDAIGAVLGAGREKSRPCRVGSVKTNIGHTEAAAGLAGLIKVALSLQHDTLPASLHFHTPSPAIDWQHLPVKINGEASPWPRSARPRLAGVSSFGISGTNAHVVVGDAPRAEPSRASSPDPSRRPRVVAYSGHTAAARDAAARALEAWLREHGDDELADVAYTTTVRRAHGEYRGTLVADSVEQARALLEGLGKGTMVPALAQGHARADQRRKVAFVFPGQGAQWLGMGRQLLSRNAAFAAELSRCDAAIAALVGWSVTAELTRPAETSRLHEIDVIQPVLFAMSAAFSAAWRAAGVVPSAVIGHSMGETAAAYVAGALTLEDAARVVCRRSELMRRKSGQGAMAVVDLPLAEAEGELAGQADRVSVAVTNSHRSTVLSGDPAALQQILARLTAREVFCRLIKVDVASHSPQMDELRGDLLAGLGGIAPRAGAVPVYSTVSRRIESGEALTPAYWVDNLRNPVHFSTMITRLLDDGFDTFVEMSPHPLLVGAVTELGKERGLSPVCVSSGRRDEDDEASFLTSMARAHCEGVEVDFSSLLPAHSRVLSLPSHQWQRERFWFAAPERGDVRGPNATLLGRPFESAAQPGTTSFAFELDVAKAPYLADHMVNGAIVVPAALFVQLGLEAARVVGGGSVCRDVRIGAAMVLRADEPRTLQLVWTTEGQKRASVRILGREPGEAANDTRWIEHASYHVLAQTDVAGPTPERPARPDADETAFDAATHYASMTRRGLEYGAAFRLVESGVRSEDALTAAVQVPVAPRGPSARTERGARLLDACLQAAVAALPAARDWSSADTFVPVAADTVFVDDDGVRGEVSCRVEPRGEPTGETFASDVIARDTTGKVVLQVENLVLRRTARESDRLTRGALYSLRWLAAPRERAAVRGGGQWLILGDPRAASVLTRALQARAATAVHRAACDVSPLPGKRWDGVVFAPLTDPGADTATNAAQAFVAALAVSRQLVSLDDDCRLWFVSRDAVAVTDSDAVAGVASATLFGLRSVIAAEYPRFRVSCVDVDAASEADALAEELLGATEEDEIALRSGSRFVRRLVRGLPAERAAKLTPASGRPYRIVSGQRGVIDSLVPEVCLRAAPGDNQVEIEVSAAGLNFMNVLGALGACPGYPDGVGPLGIECAGRVVSVGKRVERFIVGDRVMAFAHDSMATHALVHERLCARIPEGLGFESAATLPVAYLTAHHALVHLARVRAGERVLVHSATGATGLAMIVVARRAGADVMATAGTPEKREWLRQHGVSVVGDSRSTSFTAVIQRATGGEGVDVVVNSLAGDAIAAGISLLRSGGRFIELGKRDIYENQSLGLSPFRRNLSYFAVDLDGMARERPAALGDVLDEVAKAVDAGAYPALPLTTFSSSSSDGGVRDAFRTMSQATHIGKLVVRMERDRVLVREPSTALPDWSTGAVLVTGGTGALGLQLASWMVAAGARRLVLSGRSAETPALTERLRPLRAAGAVVDVIPADMGSAADVNALLGRIDAAGAPLLGVVHAAGVLRDATLLELDARGIRDVFSPKVDGALHLHAALGSRPLRFFVTFSSVAAFLGLSGQANYAAANAVLDALSAHRRAAGLAGISIAWGPWGEVGLAAAQENRGARLAERGLAGLSSAVALAAFADILGANPSHAAVMTFDVTRWRESVPSAARALLAALADERATASSAATARNATSGAPAEGVRERMTAANPGPARRAILEDHVTDLVAQVLRVSVALVDRGRPMRTLGIDSLMGLELRNRLESSLELKLPATLIWNYPTVTALSSQLGTRMRLELDAAPAAEKSGTAHSSAGEPGDANDAELDDLLDELGELSDDEARRLLTGGE